MSCVHCKEKKLKCDNNISGCENCRRFGTVCLVEDPATKRQRPRNYLDTLEQRVALLESVLRRYRPDLANDHLVQYEALRPDLESSSQPGKNQECATSNLPSNDDEDNKADEIDELASKAGLLSLNAAGAEPYYLGSSSTFAFSRLINSSLRRVVLTSSNRPGHHGQPDNSQTVLPAPCLLPSYETAVRLSDAYFKNIHTQYPFIHESTFRAWEAALAGGSIDSHPVALFFLNAVYAIGALILPNSGQSPERLYISAQMYIDHILPHDNLEAIQAILCCAVYSLRSSVGTSYWKLAGLALRQCIDLGYHRSTRRLKSTTDPLRSEMRKRVFWSAYAMESQAAVMLGRPEGIPYQEVDAEYPTDVDESCLTATGVLGAPRSSASDPPTTITKAIHTFRIRRLLSRIHSSLYSKPSCSCAVHHTQESQIQQLRSEIENWRERIPPATSHVDEALSLFSTPDWFDMEYNYAILQLYRVQIINPKAGATETVFLDCLRAAEELCHSYRRRYLGKRTSYTWTAVHELFLAGLTYLHCLWTSPAAREAHSQGQVSSTCTDCTIVLVLMAERWAAAAPYRDIFEMLARRTMIMMDGKKNGEGTPPAVSTEQSGIMDEGGLTEWVTQVANAGIPEEFDGLLNGMVPDFASSQ